jgi:biopolymer transport protein TolR
VRKPHRSAKFICRIDVTPLAAVMFALVAMFLLPAMVVIDSPRDAAHVAIDLAKASNSTDLREALREDALLVAVQRDGRIWFDRDQVTPEHLPAAIRERVNHGAERKVYIRADARAKYGAVLPVLDSVRSAGVENIAFVLEQRDAPSAH